jgi:oligopeptide transport system ATP-binding protein
MNKYDHKTAVLTHLRKHFYLGIALGLIILCLILMLVPFSSIDSYTKSTHEGVTYPTETWKTGTFSGYDMAFGRTVEVLTKSSSNGAAAAVIEGSVGLSTNVGLVLGFFFMIFAIIFIGYVYCEEQYFALAAIAAVLLAVAGIFNFCALPMSGMSNVVTGSETSASIEQTYYGITAGPIIVGILLLAAAALVIVDYFLVYTPAMENSEFVKYKQELVDNDIVLSVRHLKMFFPMGAGKKLKAVHDVSFDVKKGECFGLVGESGCGKTTTGRSIIRLHRITSGSIYFKGYRIAAGSRWNEKEIKWSTIHAKNQIKELKSQEALELENIDNVTPEGKAKTEEIKAKYLYQINQIKAELKETVKFQKEKIRQIKYDDTHVNKKLLSKMQMIFQDPIDSLDPRMTVEDIIQEGLKIQGQRNRVENHKKACEVLEEVGLIADYCSRYPNEFSGGQRQRIGIARAVVMKPELMICDEPISALDVSIRAQIINLLNDLKVNHGLTLMFIAHDLSVVKYFCDRIAVMYFGEMVELATSDELFAHPLHPYTRSLLSAIPRPDPYLEKKRVRIIYNPSVEHDYSKQKPKFQEILPGHYVLANSAEIEKYKEMIKQDDIENARKEQERKEKGLEY